MRWRMEQEQIRMIRCSDDKSKKKSKVKDRSQNSKVNTNLTYEKDIKDRTKKFGIRIIRLCAELRKNRVDLPLVNQLLRLSLIHI